MHDAVDTAPLLASAVEFRRERVAVGDVRAADDGSWQVGEARFTLRLPPGTEAAVRGGNELIVRLPDGTGVDQEVELEVQISW